MSRCIFFLKFLSANMLKNIGVLSVPVGTICAILFSDTPFDYCRFKDTAKRPPPQSTRYLTGLTAEAKSSAGWAPLLRVRNFFTDAAPISVIKCEGSRTEQFKLPESKDVSVKQMLQQSSDVAAATALQLLQLTTAAVINASTTYRNTLAAEMLLINQSLDFINIQYVQEEFNDRLIAARAQVHQSHAELLELLGFLEYVERQANGAAETAFLAGAEYSSFTLSEVLSSAQRQVLQQKMDTQLMESELRGLQQQLVLRSKPPEEQPQPAQDSSEDT